MSELEAAIKRHNDGVRTVSENRIRYRNVCTACENNTFAPHELRRRTLRLIVANSVLTVVIWLARWRCKECRRTYTDYPDFRTPV